MPKALVCYDVRNTDWWDWYPKLSKKQKFDQEMMHVLYGAVLGPPEMRAQRRGCLKIVVGDTLTVGALREAP
jgi:hypothetical protein